MNFYWWKQRPNKKSEKIWNQISYQFKNNNSDDNHEKYMKTKFNSHDDLPLGKRY